MDSDESLALDMARAESENEHENESGHVHEEDEDEMMAMAMDANASAQPAFNKETVAAVAPPFEDTHRSWAEFDARLKTYAQETFQLYVVRTTTSVKLRNQRIADQAATSKPTVVTSAAHSQADLEESKRDAGDEEADNENDRDDDARQKGGQHLIPAHWKWYSKTLMCTHGWKDRHRGTGKRVTTMARSTGCPVKMCVTLQHRGSKANGNGEEGESDANEWQLVVTKHMRTHNHPLTQELYLFYSENRRIYDPELLALVSGELQTCEDQGHDQQNLNQGQLQDNGVDDDDDNGDEGSLGMFISVNNGGRLSAQLVPEYQLPASEMLSNPHADPILPLTTPTAFSSWAHFHKVLTEYSTATQNNFRIRSTISAVSKNTKLLEQAAKAGKSADEMAVQLVPEALKWYSKLIICDHGWRRKSRSKTAQFQTRGTEGDVANETTPSCPAMFMVRAQRDVRNEWRIVIFRKVLEHSHVHSELRPSEPVATEDITIGAEDINEAAMSAYQHGETTLAQIDQTSEVNASGSHSHLEEDEELTVSEDEDGGVQEKDLPTTEELNELSTDQAPEMVQPTAPVVEAIAETTQPPTETEAAPPQEQVAVARTVARPVNVVTEVVVRVPSIQSVHESWDAFHAYLQQYSEATYQLYRTRTTSSVKGRNQKIMEMRAGNGNANANASALAADEDGDEALTSSSDVTRLIPEQYKWYSKTLTCTHGWKERRRGSGKRTVHIVRSTLCPVKICATLQYVVAVENPGWYVVVTKHIVDHNHNLSRALYLHYCDNRRIYDPQLLAIDQPAAPAPAATTPAVESDLSGGDTGAAEMLAHENIMEAQQQPSFLGGQAELSFDQVDSFDSDQHTLPDSAYIASNSGLSGHHQALLPFTAQLMANANAMGQHQLFAMPPGFGNASYTVTGDLAINQQLSMSVASAQAKSVATNVTCQVHGTATGSYSANDLTSGVFGVRPDCTCLRVSVVQQYAPSQQVAAEASSAESDPAAVGSRRPATSQPQTMAASKRPRLEASSDETFQQATDPSISNGAPDAIAPIWAPENPVKAIAFTDEDGTRIWRAPRLRRRHTDWAAFSEFLEAYSVSTYQLYRVRTTSSIQARNTRITQQMQRESGGSGVGGAQRPDQTQAPHENEGDEDGGDDEEDGGAGGSKNLQLVPTSYEWYSKTYVCTHGWKERRRGKGQRVSHNLRSTACPVKLCVTLQRNPHGPEDWNVVVTKQVTDHNHVLSSSVFESYSENRRIKDPALLTQAEHMWREGQPRRKIFEYLKGAARTRIVMKDVHNLVQRWQQQHPGVGSGPLSGVDSFEALGAADTTDHEVVGLV